MGAWSASAQQRIAELEAKVALQDNQLAFGEGMIEVRDERIKVLTEALETSGYINPAGEWHLLSCAAGGECHSPCQQARAVLNGAAATGGLE